MILKIQEMILEVIQVLETQEILVILEMIGVMAMILKSLRNIMSRM